MIRCKEAICEDLRKLFESKAEIIQHFINSIESSQKSSQLHSSSQANAYEHPASKRPCLEGCPLTGRRIPNCLQFSIEELRGEFSVTLTNKKEDYDMFCVYYHELAHLSYCTLGCDVSFVNRC